MCGFLGSSLVRRWRTTIAAVVENLRVAQKVAQNERWRSVALLGTRCSGVTPKSALR